MFLRLSTSGGRAEAFPAATWAGGARRSNVRRYTWGFGGAAGGRRGGPPAPTR